MTFTYVYLVLDFPCSASSIFLSGGLSPGMSIQVDLLPHERRATCANTSVASPKRARANKPQLTIRLAFLGRSWQSQQNLWDSFGDRLPLEAATLHILANILRRMAAYYHKSVYRCMTFNYQQDLAVPCGRSSGHWKMLALFVVGFSPSLCRWIWSCSTSREVWDALNVEKMGMEPNNR